MIMMTGQERKRTAVLTCSQKVQSGAGTGEVNGKVHRGNALPPSTSLRRVLLLLLLLRGVVGHLPGKGGPRSDSLHVSEIAEISEVHVPEVLASTGGAVAASSTA